MSSEQNPTTIWDILKHRPKVLSHSVPSRKRKQTSESEDESCDPNSKSKIPKHKKHYHVTLSTSQNLKNNVLPQSNNSDNLNNNVVKFTPKSLQEIANNVMSTLLSGPFCESKKSLAFGKKGKSLNLNKFLGP